MSTNVWAVLRLAPITVSWLLLCSWLATGCGGEGDAAVQTGPPERRTVEVAPALRTTHARTLTLSGTLTPMERVQVAARVEGPITDVRVDLGDVVTRDQVLAAIRPVDYRARVSELEAGLVQAQNDVKRAQDLGNAATGEELEQARTRLAEARAQRSLASRQLGDTTVRAPFAGSISARHVAPGTYVKSGALLFDLVAIDRLRLTLEVPERYAALVGPGTPVTIGAREMIQTGPKEQTEIGLKPGADRVQATVTRVSPIVSPSTRTFTIEALFSPAGSVLKPGMFIAATLALGDETQGVRVPRSAVFHVLGHDRVMKVVDGVAQPHDIEMVGEDAGEAIVLGLEPGTQVIARSPAQVAPGTLVTAEEMIAETPAVPAGSAAPATSAAPVAAPAKSQPVVPANEAASASAGRSRP